MKCEIDVDFVKNDPNLARKFMFPDETKKVRKYANVFALFNNNVFKELLYFEEYFLKSLIGNFKVFSERNIENITKNHLIWAELLSDIGDVNSIIAKA